ncbi:hypothetical protein BC828DRAFT_382862 [Blastocladiella britannica]|nr:hypothetical protein BC828DRAFT_382862 [Blastocladiella britannica]
MSTPNMSIWFTGPIESVAPAGFDPRPPTVLHRFESASDVHADATWLARTPLAPLPSMAAPVANGAKPAPTGVKYYLSLITHATDSWANMAVSLHFEVPAGGGAAFGASPPGPFVARIAIMHGAVSTRLALFVPSVYTDPMSDPASLATPATSESRGAFIGKRVTLASNPLEGKASVLVRVQFVPVVAGAPSVPLLLPAAPALLEFLDVDVPAVPGAEAEAEKDDVVLQAGAATTVRASRTILAAASPYFKALLLSPASTGPEISDKDKDDAASTPLPPSPTKSETSFANATIPSSGTVTVPGWSPASLVLSLVHIYSGWTPGAAVPREAANRIFPDHGIVVDDLDVDDWREVFAVAKTLGLARFAAAVNRQMAHVLDEEHRRLLAQDSMDAGGFVFSDADSDSDSDA